MRHTQCACMRAHVIACKLHLPGRAGRRASRGERPNVNQNITKKKTPPPQQVDCNKRDSICYKYQMQKQQQPHLPNQTTKCVRCGIKLAHACMRTSSYWFKFTFSGPGAGLAHFSRIRTHTRAHTLALVPSIIQYVPPNGLHTHSHAPCVNCAQ